MSCSLFGKFWLDFMAIYHGMMIVFSFNLVVGDADVLPECSIIIGSDMFHNQLML